MVCLIYNFSLFLYPTKCCITWATVPTTVVLICFFKQNTILLAHNILTQASYKRMSQVRHPEMVNVNTF